MVNAKEELHQLVDRLGDERAGVALRYLRHLVREGVEAKETTPDQLDARMEPLTISGRAFFARPRVDWETLAAQQGIRPVTHLDDLIGDFWPEEESLDDFIVTVQQWRREGGYA